MSEAPAKRVPEIILKRRKRSEDNSEKQDKQSKFQRRQSKAAKRFKFTKLQSYVKRNLKLERQEVLLRRLAKTKQPTLSALPPSKIALVIRIDGTPVTNPKARKILSLLRLQRQGYGVFVRLNESTIQMLRLIEPFITYGYPSLKTIKELVTKRGFAKTKGRPSLNENALIEKILGPRTQNAIICVDDIIHELYTAGPHFRMVNHFLLPFRLGRVRGGLKKKSRAYANGGDAGNRQGRIDRLVRRML